MDNRELRESIVKALYDVATVKWTPDREFHEVTRPVLEGKRKPYSYYRVGETYYGMPFTKRQKVWAPAFLGAVEREVLEVPEDRLDFFGADCTSSMIISMPRTANIPLRYLTSDFLYDRDVTTVLGPIVLDSRRLHTDAYKERFPADDYYEGYALLGIGDVVSSCYRKPEGGMVDHSRMVSGTVRTVRDGDGKINPEESYVIVVENVAALTDMSDENNFGGKVGADDYVVPFEPKADLTDIKSFSDLKGKKTNFRINRKITFKSLYVNNYIPLTFNFYHS